MSSDDRAPVSVCVTALSHGKSPQCVHVHVDMCRCTHNVHVHSIIQAPTSVHVGRHLEDFLLLITLNVCTQGSTVKASC